MVLHVIDIQYTCCAVNALLLLGWLQLPVIAPVPLDEQDFAPQGRPQRLLGSQPVLVLDLCGTRAR